MRNRNLIIALAAAALPAAAHGSILLYEPFDYGTTATSLSGVSGAATGLDGTTYSTAGTTEYLSTGLTFSNLATRGGTAKIAYDSQEKRDATRGIDFSLTSGTLFGSMLYRSSGAADNGISDLLLTSSASHGDTSAKLAVAGNEYDKPNPATNLMGIRTFGQGTKATGTAMPGDGSVTNLILFQVSNIGATAGTQTVDAWVLTAAQFDNFRSGGLTTAELNAATTGAASADVLQKVNHTNTGAGGYISLADTDFLRLVSFRAGGSFDEIRLGTSSLDEVTPIPEPTSIAVLGGIAALGLLRRRR